MRTAPKKAPFIHQGVERSPAHRTGRIKAAPGAIAVIFAAVGRVAGYSRGVCLSIAAHPVPLRAKVYIPAAVRACAAYALMPVGIAYPLLNDGAARCPQPPPVCANADPAARNSMIKRGPRPRVGLTMLEERRRNPWHKSIGAPRRKILSIAYQDLGGMSRRIPV